jgi:hypothetical protein
MQIDDREETDTDRGLTNPCARRSWTVREVKAWLKREEGREAHMIRDLTPARDVVRRKQ